MRSEVLEPGDVTVSVVMVTYNHALYIAEAIESVLVQETDFGFELIIGEDCSTDGTREIVKNYYKRYPDRVRLLLQGQNVGPPQNAIETIRACRGRYVAFCDGDDYWTDPSKLQQQVDFLEANPEYSLCCSAFVRVDPVRDETTVINKCSGVSSETGFTFSLEDMKGNWMTQSLTSMLRRDALREFLSKRYVHCRDIHLFYHVVKTGLAFYFNKVFGVYRFHGRGIHSGNFGRVNINASYMCSRELYEQNHDDYTHRLYLRSAIRLFNFDLTHRYEGNTFRRKLRLLSEALHLAGNSTEYLWIVKGFVPLSVKSWLRQVTCWNAQVRLD